MFLLLFRSNLQLHCKLVGTCIYRKCAFRHLGHLWVEGEWGCAAIYSNFCAVGTAIFAKVITAFESVSITCSIIIIYKIAIGL